MPKLASFALKDTPNLIESGIFPIQKISYEAQRERKSGSGQTLTGIGSYWKGRKPLILVRAVVLGLLLPKTGSDKQDLRILEQLLALDSQGLARRAFAKGKLRLDEIYTTCSPLMNLSDYIELSHSPSQKTLWKKNVSKENKIDIIERFLDTFSSYADKAHFCLRPEEVEQDWLYKPIWPKIRKIYARWGVYATSFDELILQLGILRFGKRPRVGDPFAGGGSIPFEAARLGCDVYAGDLNPIACMLNWGSFNIVGASDSKREEIKNEIKKIYSLVLNEINALNFDTNEDGEFARNYLYCNETRCPQTNWRIPVSGSWVVSKPDKLFVDMIPNYSEEKFDLVLKRATTPSQLTDANQGTVRNDHLIYFLDDRKISTPIKMIRGDYINKEGDSKNRLRPWSKSDVEPQADDIFTEKLYAIQWNKKNKSTGKIESYFCEPTASDLLRGELVSHYVTENLSQWQSVGLVPNMVIEGGKETDRLLRERGWTYWHHFFNPRQILIQKMFFYYAKQSRLPAEMIALVSKLINRNNRGCAWDSLRVHSGALFYNQALNTFWNYCSRSSYNHATQWETFKPTFREIPNISKSIACRPASTPMPSDIFISDPPYADAVVYHEITEIFIAWLQGELPLPLNEWTWDSRRPLAISGSGLSFRQGMIEAYSAMTKHMPDNGYQCLMFTHSNVKVWSDITNILWASGLQVISAWCVATETATSFRDGNHIQGTVLLILRKRPSDEKSGFKQNILPKVRNEVERQVFAMMNMSRETMNEYGESIFNDADIQMAGQAAALKVLTSFTNIGGEDVTKLAFRTDSDEMQNVVGEIILHSISIANNTLVPDQLDTKTWPRCTGIERFYLKMMDTDTNKLDTFQIFAKAYRVNDYNTLMSNATSNKAKLKLISEFKSRELSSSTEIGQSNLGKLIVALQQLSISNIDPEKVITHFRNSITDFLSVREDLINILKYIEVRSPEMSIREAAAILLGQLRNLRIF